MSIVHTVGRGVAWNTLATVIGKVVIFANVFLMLHFLTVYEYGLGQLVLSIVSMLNIFLLPGLSSAILADLAAERGRQEYGKMKSLFWQFSIASMLLSTVAWALLFFGSNIAAHIYSNDTVGNFLKIASFTLLISPVRTIVNMLAGVELRYFDQSFYPILEEIAKCVFLVLFLFFLHIGLKGMLLAIVLSQIVALVIYLPRSISAYATFKTAHASDVNAFWRIIREHRKWSIATSYLGNLGQALQLWLIKFFLGTEAVGLFSFAQGIYSQVAGFLPLNAVLAPLLPRYTEHRSAFARYVQSAVKAHLALAAALVAATFIGLPILVMLFPKYGPSIPMLSVLIFSLFPVSVMAIYIPVFNALKQQFSYFQSMVWKTAFILVFLTVPIYFFGMLGAGIGYVLLTFANTIERTVRLRRILPEFAFTWHDIFIIDDRERELIRRLTDEWKHRFASLTDR